MIVQINVKNKFGEGSINLPRYVIDYSEPVGIVFGKFSPWTGINGHGRLIELLKQNHIEQFYIVSPKRDETRKDDCNLFSPESRKLIIERIITDSGFLGYIQAGSNNVHGVIKEMIHKVSRPVFVIGPDRETLNGKTFVPFGSSPITDETDKDFGKPECLVYRGSRDVSGTLVRQSIRNNDFQKFHELTKYSIDDFEYMKNLANLS